MYEQPQPGRRIGPALIALIAVLAAAAGTVGYLGAREIMASERNTPAGGDQTTGPNDPAGPGQPPGSGEATPGQATSAPGRPPADPPDGSCPPLTEAAVRAAGLGGSLELVLHIEASRRGAANAEVWICRNSEGTLVYQGWVKSAPFSAATSNNTLLLGEGILGTVVRDGASFLATNPGSATRTEYWVTQEQLTQQTLPGGSLIVYQVIDVDLP